MVVRIKRHSQVNFRTSESERRLIEKAAELSGRPIGEFIREAALRQAEIVVADLTGIAPGRHAALREAARTSALAATEVK